MGILFWSLVGETPRCLKPSPLPVWQLLLLLSLRPSQRLLLIPTFCMADMEDMVVMDMDTTDTMASVRLSPRLLLIPTFSMADMETMDTMASVRLSPRLLDKPTTDKLYLTQHQNGQPNIQPSLFPLSVTRFQCLISFWVTNSRKQ